MSEKSVVPDSLFISLLSVLRRYSVVVDLLFGVLIGCGGSVFVCVLLCITLYPF